MALSNADLEGMELVTERKPEKAGGVTVSTIPEVLVNLLKDQAPKALADKDYELILRVPVRAPEPEPLAKDAKDADRKAHAEATEAYQTALKSAIDTAKQLTLYAAAWGKGQDPKLYVHKVPNRKDMPAHHARLSVQLDSEVSKDNRPGRR